jgi:cell division septum initiation protein DivIVA
MARLDNTFLEAALLGYQAEQKRIQAAIADLQKRIGGGKSSSATPKSTPVARKKHRISAEGRARIAAAQRKRWAASKKEDSSR